MLREDSGKISASRVNLASSILAFWIVFLFWMAATLGLFFDLWPWERFHDAIVAGGLGLLGVVFGAVGGYSVNRYARSRKASSVFEEEEDRWAE
jgi:hypothetical protein